MLWIPMVFMMAVTFTALGMTIYKLTKALFSVGLDLGNSLQLIFAVLPVSYTHLTLPTILLV